MSDNIEDLQKQFDSLRAEKETLNVSKQFDKKNAETSMPASMLRGALSGLTAGTWPYIAGAVTTGGGLLGDISKSIAESEAAQEKAWQDNPVAYVIGYGGGFVPSLVAAGPKVALAAGKGIATAGKAAAPFLEKAFVEGAEQALPVGGKKAAEFATGVASGMKNAAAESGVFDRITGYLAGRPNIKGVPVGNPGARVSYLPQSGVAGYNAAVSSDAERIGGDSYATESDKRVEAMRRLSTPEGRAQTNTDR